jgi:hypothetical protein
MGGQPAEKQPGPKPVAQNMNDDYGHKREDGE